MMLIVWLIAASLDMANQAAPPSTATCRVQAPAIVGRSVSGEPQVSNLELLDIECRRSPARRPASSGVQLPLKIDAVVYQVSGQGERVIVPSQVSAHGSSGDANSESASFFLAIPIDDAERDAGTSAFFAEVKRRAAASTPDSDVGRAAPLLQNIDPKLFAQMVRQQRVGRFHVEFTLLETPARQSVDSGIVVDPTRPVDSAALDLEVVFKGTFFDQLLRSK